MASDLEASRRIESLCALSDVIRDMKKRLSCVWRRDETAYIMNLTGQGESQKSA